MNPIWVLEALNIPQNGLNIELNGKRRRRRRKRRIKGQGEEKEEGEGE